METNIWMVRSWPEGGIDKLTRQKDVIAIGWPQVGDLSPLLALSEQEAQTTLKNRLTQASYSEEESALIATQLLRFCHPKGISLMISHFHANFTHHDKR